MDCTPVPDATMDDVKNEVGEERWATLVEQLPPVLFCVLKQCGWGCLRAVLKCI